MRSRPIRLEVCFNEKEYENLCNLCEETNLKKGRLIRLLLAGYVPPPAPPVEYNKLIREVRAVGNNINQIAKVANTNHATPSAALLADMYQDVQTLRHNLEPLWDETRGALWQS